MLARALQLTHRRRYDVLLCGAAYPTALIGYVAHRCTGTPYAVYAHGEDVAAAAGSALTSAALRRALRSAGAVLANSSFTAGEIAAIGVPSEHVEVVHPWIDLAPFQQVDGQRVEALGQRLGLAGHRVVLTTARLDERKGHDVVIRALPAIVQAIPNALYLVVGKGDSTGLQALAERLGVGDCVRFVEYMAEDDLAALYGLCDVFVMVSRRDEVSGLVEGFGMVYLEAGAVGKPVVAGTHGGCADAVVDGVSGLVVDPTAPEQVARAVVRILSDAELAAHMSQAGRERAATFAKPKQVERVAAVLRGLARC